MKMMWTFVWVLFYSALQPIFLPAQSENYPGVRPEGDLLRFESIESYQQIIEQLRTESEADTRDSRGEGADVPCATGDPVLEQFEATFSFRSLRKEQLEIECSQLEAGRDPSKVTRHWMFDNFVAATLNGKGQVKVGSDIMYLYAPTLTYLVPGGDLEVLRQLERGANPYTFPGVEVYKNGAECSANFSFNASQNSNTVNFSYQGMPSFGSYDLLWEFGDGETSTDQNPTHTYATGGTYEVCLNLEVSGEEPCMDRVCKQVMVGESGCLAAFIYNETGVPGQICFQDISSFLGSVVSWEWNFGDGNTSSEQNPCHTFACDKTYYVNLTITTQSGCSSTFGLPVWVNSNQCCGKKAEYSNSLEYNSGQKKIIHHQAQFNLPFFRLVAAQIIHYKKKSNGKWKRSKADLKIGLEGDVFLPGAAGCKCEMPFEIDFQASKDNRKVLTVGHFVGSPFKARQGEEWVASFFVNGNLLAEHDTYVYCD